MNSPIANQIETKPAVKSSTTSATKNRQNQKIVIISPLSKLYVKKKQITTKINLFSCI